MAEAQFIAPQGRKQLHRPLNVRNPTAGQPPATKCDRLQIHDSRTHPLSVRNNSIQHSLPKKRRNVTPFFEHSKKQKQVPVNQWVIENPQRRRSTFLKPNAIGATRRKPWSFDRQLYARRNEVERLFGRLKRYRRVGTRYDKLDVMFAGFIYPALIYEMIRNLV